jgi:four helix bundle protein
MNNVVSVVKETIKERIMENALYEKSKKFGIRILKLAKLLESDNQKSIANQILRSGTSIGANISEANYASSRADFINKLRIARKEAGETEYWLELLHEGEILNKELFVSLQTDVKELHKMLCASVMTAQKNS